MNVHMKGNGQQRNDDYASAQPAQRAQHPRQQRAEKKNQREPEFVHCDFAPERLQGAMIELTTLLKSETLRVTSVSP